MRQKGLQIFLLSVIQFILLGAFQGAGLMATIYVPIDSTSLSRVELSKHFQNRISLDCGRITQIVHPGCDIDINLDDEIGHVFVYPLTNYPKPTSLTVISDKGQVQDLELNFVDKPGEIVILETLQKVFDEEVEEGEIITTSHPDYYKMVVESVLENRVPEGFLASDVPKKCRNIRKGVQAVLVSRLISCEETIYIWRIENCTPIKQKIQEKDLTFQKARWKYLDSLLLQKHGYTTAIVGVKNS